MHNTENNLGMILQALILAGGQSSRMGSRKELLHHPSGLPMYQYLVQTISQACPRIATIHMSIKNENSMPLHDLPDLPHTQTGLKNVPLQFIYDRSQDTNANPEDIGPAAGLLAAYRTHPDVNWLIVACDFPLLNARTLTRLISAQQESQSASVTCYRNSKGFCEPLLAVWTPKALAKLAENVRQGRTGPRFVLDESPDAQIISPDIEMELFNVNTVEEWEEACRLFGSKACVNIFQPEK